MLKELFPNLKPVVAEAVEYQLLEKQVEVVLLLPLLLDHL
jgi:mannose/fructose/N-acetylgalactosamine-specific phosphotransferase system component IID